MDSEIKTGMVIGMYGLEATQAYYLTRVLSLIVAMGGYSGYPGFILKGLPPKRTLILSMVLGTGGMEDYCSRRPFSSACRLSSASFRRMKDAAWR